MQLLLDPQQLLFNQCVDPLLVIVRDVVLVHHLQEVLVVLSLAHLATCLRWWWRWCLGLRCLLSTLLCGRPGFFKPIYLHGCLKLSMSLGRCVIIFCANELTDLCDATFLNFLLRLNALQ